MGSGKIKITKLCSSAPCFNNDKISMVLGGRKLLLDISDNYFFVLNSYRSAQWEGGTSWELALWFFRANLSFFVNERAK